MPGRAHIGPINCGKSGAPPGTARGILGILVSFRPFPRSERLGPYELVRRLATGGMAEVYEAKRVGPHGFSKRLALKRISPEQLWSGIAAQRARRLASLLAFRDVTCASWKAQRAARTRSRCPPRPPRSCLGLPCGAFSVRATG